MNILSKFVISNEFTSHFMISATTVKCGENICDIDWLTKSQILLTLCGFLPIFSPPPIHGFSKNILFIYF